MANVVNGSTSPAEKMRLRIRQRHQALAMARAMEELEAPPPPPVLASEDFVSSELHPQKRTLMEEDARYTRHFPLGVAIHL